jgi:hypothetical protein
MSLWERAPDKDHASWGQPIKDIVNNLYTAYMVPMTDVCYSFNPLVDGKNFVLYVKYEGTYYKTNATDYSGSQTSLMVSSIGNDCRETLYNLKDNSLEYSHTATVDSWTTVDTDDAWTTPTNQGITFHEDTVFNQENLFNQDTMFNQDTVFNQENLFNQDTMFNQGSPMTPEQPIQPSARPQTHVKRDLMNDFNGLDMDMETYIESLIDSSDESDMETTSETEGHVMTIAEGIPVDEANLVDYEYSDSEYSDEESSDDEYSDEGSDTDLNEQEVYESDEDEEKGDSDYEPPDSEDEDDDDDGEPTIVDKQEGTRDSWDYDEEYDEYEYYDELREDLDGEWYTRRQFYDYYGSDEAWDNLEPEVYHQYRYDEQYHEWHTKEEFYQHYGSNRMWKRMHPMRGMTRRAICDAYHWASYLPENLQHGFISRYLNTYE